MSLYDNLLKGEDSVSVMGLGYVGIPTAIAFSKKYKVIGFDLDENKIELYKMGIDPTSNVGNDELRNSSIEFTCDEQKLKDAKFHIVAVPTPVKADNTPDLSQIENASRILGRNLSLGSIVVFESTVYPGMTEKVCIPILEKESNLKCGRDFKVGYSPERINPGDKIHCFENIQKIVSATDEESLSEISNIYQSVVKAGVYKAPSIKVAEAAKVVENAQRDVNIAFINEISVIFNEMGIDTKDVLEAAGTKWNFLKFSPGLVGGGCIGVDPYYLIHRANEFGVESKVMVAARTVNDSIGKHVGENTVLSLAKAGKIIENAKVAILGFTFKEDFPDIRNTKVFNIAKTLNEYGIKPLIYDPVADFEETKRHYGVELCEKSALKDLDAVVFAVSHKEFLEYDFSDIDSLYKDRKKVLIDVKGIFDRKKFENAGYVYWRL